MEFLTDLRRTHRNGELRGSNVGDSVVLMGWVNTRRDPVAVFLSTCATARHYAVPFRFDDRRRPVCVGRWLRNEYVLAISGVVESRGGVNPRMKTGGGGVLARKAGYERRNCVSCPR